MRGRGELVELTVPVAELAARCSPFDGSEWDCDPIDPDDVLKAAAEGRLETETWQTVNDRNRRNTRFDDHAWHVGRMAFFLVNAAEMPLEIEVEAIVDGPRKACRLRIYSGNHRFGAAMLRGDASVRARAPAAEIDRIFELLPGAKGVPCPPCGGSGREDNHVTGEVACPACDGSGVETFEDDCEAGEGGPTP